MLHKYNEENVLTIKVKVLHSEKPTVILLYYITSLGN